MTNHILTVTIYIVTNKIVYDYKRSTILTFYNRLLRLRVKPLKSGDTKLKGLFRTNCQPVAKEDNSMTRISENEKRTLNGGASYAQCYKCGTRKKITGLFSSWSFALHQMFCRG